MIETTSSLPYKAHYCTPRFFVFGFTNYCFLLLLKVEDYVFFVFVFQKKKTTTTKAKVF